MTFKTRCFLKSYEFPTPYIDFLGGLEFGETIRIHAIGFAGLVSREVPCVFTHITTFKPNRGMRFSMDTVNQSFVFFFRAFQV